MNTKLYVGNLAYSTMEHQLRAAFEPHGALVSAAVVIDRMSGQSRGFGFVEYTNEADGQRAIDAMNGAELDGRVITVNVARPRGASGGRDSGPRRGGNRGDRW